MLFGARLLQKTAMLVTSAEREVEPSMPTGLDGGTT